jgi:hypothetical protein
MGRQEMKNDTEPQVDDETIIFDETQNKERKEKKRQSASDKYYKLPEEEIQILVAKAKKGDSIAQAQLLEIFNNFITKYVSLLYKGKFDLHDYDIRRFISIFVPDKGTQIRLKYNKINHQTFKEVNKVVSGINFIVKRYGDEEDVRQTVQMSFLYCVNKYERRGSIPFSGFIYNYMFFILQKNVKDFLIDQLGRHSFPLYSDDSVSSSYNADGSDANSINVAPITPALEDLLGPEEIDEYWVLGDTAMFPFDKLTTHQRQLLKWRYIDGIKASQIAIKTTEHPNTCRAQLQEIRTEIAELLKNEIL